MIYSIIEIIATILDVVFLIWFIPNFLNTKFYHKENLRFLFIPFLFLALQFTADFLRIPFDTTIAIGIILLSTIYALSICHKQWGKAILAGSIYILVIMLSSSLLYVILSSLIDNIDSAIQGSDSPARVIYLAIGRSVQFVIYKLQLLLFKKNDNVDKKNGIAFLLFSLFTICGLFALMAIAVHDSMQAMNLPILVMLMVLVLSNIAIWFFIHQILNMQKKEFEYKLLEERMHFEQLRTEDANTIWDNIRKVRHDLKNHFTVLKAKLANGKIDECLSYIEQIYPKIESMGNLVHTNNSTLDYLINTKIPDNQDIKVLVSGYANAFSDIDDCDFASLLGNMLDNAFEAVSQIKSPIAKQVELHFLYKNQNRMIVCRNTIEKSVLKYNKILKSTKSGPNHGLGHLIIDTIATKYNGFVSYTEKDNLFCVQVTLPFPKG